MKRAALLLFLALACGAPAFAAPTPGTFTDPALESRARALQRELRCLVCQGESIDESGAPLAADLRALVRAHIAAGESNQQIKDYLVARYGDFILMQPPFQPDTFALWLAPFLILVGGGGVVFFVVRAARRQAEMNDGHKIADL